VSDATFSELAMHFTDEDIAQITWLCAMENYYNLLTRPLKIGSDGLCSI
jgi:alkylhydroperoxidase family enzyme